MSNSPSWFDENEYSNFLAESMILFEMNIPLQKEKIESRKKLREFDRQLALRRFNLRRQNMRDEAQAKARGIQMGLGEGFIKEKLSKLFFEKLAEEKTPVKAEKRKMRPEVDPADRERDRKREDRRQTGQESELKRIIIVKDNKRNKVEIIPKDDYDPNYHTVLKGKVKKIDKGNVSNRDLRYYSKMDNFINTKTSVRLIGKVQKEQEKEEKPKKQKAKVETPEMQTPPPPRPRAPVDGKEITDPTSTYPDWDHTNTQMSASIPVALNSMSGGAMPKQFDELLSTSRTLSDSVNRFIQEIMNEYPQIADMKLVSSEPVNKTSKSWSKMGIEKATPNASVVGAIKGEKATVGFALKIGEQIRPGIQGEANAVLMSVLTALPEEQLIPTFSLFVEDFIQDLRSSYSRIPSPPPTDIQKQGTITLAKQRWERETVKIQRDKLTTAARNLIERFINENDLMKSAFINESLTGMIKFDGKTGSAQMLMCGKKDGSDAAVTQINETFIDKLAKSEDTNLSFKFSNVAPAKGGMLESLMQMITSTLAETTMDVVSELQRMKDQLSNPMIFVQLFELVLEDATYKLPILYSEFIDQMNADTYNTVILNYGTDKQQELQIPVRINYNPQGQPESVVEKGADAILEQYILINDLLVEEIKKGNIDLLDSLLILEQQFNFTEDRNYRQEYDNYHGKPEQRANRSKRVLARRKMEDEGEVKKGDGKDVHHKDGDPQNNSDGNLEVMSKSKNRSMNEDYGAGFEGTDQLVQTLIDQTPFAINPIRKKLSAYIEDRYLKKTKKK